MKRFYLFIFFILPVFTVAQLPPTIDSLVQTADSASVKDTALPKKDSAALFKDSVVRSKAQLQEQYVAVIKNALQRSTFLQSEGLLRAYPMQEVKPVFNDLWFYILLSVVIFFAFLRFLYERYFNNMFRVFFNTSLRQSQLTDQLLQAKQVSLLFNVLFVCTGGLYIYFLLLHFRWIQNTMPLMTMGACILSLAVLYLLKYSSLKITGWVSGYRTAASTYLFIIFLINKILGVLLLPFVIVVAFGKSFLQFPAVLSSLLLIGLMFFLRFLRSYSLLRKDIKVSRWHFFIYILGVELLPLFLIYKALVILFGKNL